MTRTLDTPLLTRETAGFRVTLDHDFATGISTVTVRDGEDEFVLTSADRALAVEMFYHPYIYIKEEHRVA